MQVWRKLPRVVPRSWKNLGPVGSFRRAIHWVVDAEGEDGTEPRNACPLSVPLPVLIGPYRSPYDLVELPFWDSFDWLGFVIEIEQQLHGEIALPGHEVLDAAIKMAGGSFAEVRVEHVVKATALAASHRPNKTLFDEDW
jgi:hypothetical protein